MHMAREGLNGEHIADTSKQTVAWTISILAAEVKRLEKENFTLRWEPAKLKARAEAAEERVAELRAQNARLRAALEQLDALHISSFDCDEHPPRPEWLKAALNGEEAST